MNNTKTIELKSTKNPDVLIFGAGQITNLLIKKLNSNGKNILCISNNYFNQVGIYPNCTILSYKEIANKKLNANTTIFSWKDASILNQNNNALLSWLESDYFSTKKSILLSSASVYRDSPIAQNEINTNLEINQKLKLEILLKSLHLKHRFNHTNLRISNIYGINIEYGFIGSLFSSAKSGSEISVFQDMKIIRDYVHVADVIDAIEQLIEIDSHDADVNISTGVGTSISEVLEIFAKNSYKFEKRRRIPMTPELKQSSVLNCGALSRLIRWHPGQLEDVITKLLLTI
jgi:nucleoside-diphosphate-sugar epimerase